MGQQRVCVCVRVCVCEREREKIGGGGRGGMRAQTSSHSPNMDKFCGVSVDKFAPHKYSYFIIAILIFLLRTELFRTTLIFVFYYCNSRFFVTHRALRGRRRQVRTRGRSCAARRTRSLRSWCRSESSASSADAPLARPFFFFFFFFKSIR
ncbi:hypothetical protein T492DRAFT_80111 [Pavlovales sp. CCMP2436]|nr:hypothetical protein T492DRAFT_80111 [Pavlovales sp. CCMP2436]